MIKITPVARLCVGRNHGLTIMQQTPLQWMGALALVTALHGAEFHVATTGNDTNPGSQAAPLRSIQHAADLAQPGDLITVHEGTYRERVNPPRGGTSDQQRIVYQAAPGEKVVITGAETVTGWVKAENDTWAVILPNSFFGDFNPYGDLLRGDWFDPQGRDHHTGAVYLDGDWLDEAATLDEVMKPAGDHPLWFGQVDDTQTTIRAQFKGIDPNKDRVAINVRQTVFYPRKPGVDYITLRGFTLCRAATPWAPPTVEQIGLVGTHWSKGWIIENNHICYSKCTGITLGKYGEEADKGSGTAKGYAGTITRALAYGWNKQTVGSHLVRNNEISHCEQAGIAGSLGCSFSTITDNSIHDINVRHLFAGAEVAGLKLHGGIDVIIRHNHIYRTVRAIWLDWMAQGARVTGNLCHDNGPGHDLFVEVNHGPLLVDHNVFLSPPTLEIDSQGTAYVHNLFAGSVHVNLFDGRKTPYHKPHSTEVVALHDNPSGDDRYYNNIFAGNCDLSVYNDAKSPVWMSGNVFLQASKPSNHEKNPLLLPDFNPQIQLAEKPDGFYLEMTLPQAWREQNPRSPVTAGLLGKAAIPDQSYERPDGSPVDLDADFSGRKTTERNPLPGPFQLILPDQQVIKVW